MDATMPRPMNGFYFFPESNPQQMHRMGNGMPPTPIYSRPGSSCAQPPTLYSNGPSTMTPTGASPLMVNHKPAIMLDTDFSDSPYFPSTPPLSSSGSSVGSPKNLDMLQTPLNPMFSGIDGMQDMESAENTVVDWQSCVSPPMTPVYLQSFSGKAPPSFGHTSSDLSTTSCPSLSPSPTPYARSIASEDFCDPRNLTVTSAPASSVPAQVTVSLADIKTEQPESVPAPLAAKPVLDFDPTLPDGLPSFEELSDLESEEDFVNSLVNLDDKNTADVGRPRACTGSSVVSLGHGSCFGDEDLTFEDDSLNFLPLPSPPTSMVSEDCHQNKRQKKTHIKSAAPVMDTAANGEAAPVDSGKTSDETVDESAANDESGMTSGSEDANNAPSAPTRRGRKQSLTEDPSKQFVCELCNRRFRRQEHLKRHYRSLHTQDKPFTCGDCGKTFSRSDNLAQHARTHGASSMVMDVMENGEGQVPMAHDPSMGGQYPYETFGKVLFQIAQQYPGSDAPTDSSGESSDDGKKKRKRAD